MTDRIRDYEIKGGVEETSPAHGTLMGQAAPDLLSTEGRHPGITTRVQASAPARGREREGWRAQSENRLSDASRIPQ